eukprot:gene27839-33009_t
MGTVGDFGAMTREVTEAELRFVGEAADAGAAAAVLPTLSARTSPADGALAAGT